MRNANLQFTYKFSGWPGSFHDAIVFMNTDLGVNFLDCTPWEIVDKTRHFYQVILLFRRSKRFDDTLRNNMYINRKTEKKFTLSFEFYRSGNRTVVFGLLSYAI